MTARVAALLALALVACDATTDAPSGDASDAAAPIATAPDGAPLPPRDAGAFPDAPPGAAPDAALPPPAARGATLPFWEYEAEAATTNGVILGPSRTFGEIAAESSGRRAVRLEANGQGVEFVLEHPASSIVVRYVVPDAPGGGGIDATLGVYVGGARAASLALTSRYAWVYGGESDSSDNTPGPGAHHFYDEAHLLLGELAAGTHVRLQKDAEDTAAYVVIDLVDFEEVAPPLAPPPNALSIVDFGATADDASDDAAAIQKTIDAAKAQGKTVWIPKGTYECVAAPLVVSGVTLRGAGMWWSTLHGANAQIKVSGDANGFYDFALFGDVVTRDDQRGDNGLDGPAGKGSRLENVWIEHEKCGWWVGKGAYSGVPAAPLTDGLVIHGARIRDTFADGVNFCNGTRNSVVEQSHLRNTGDDALAAWSPTFDGVADANDVFRFDTVQLPWRADCFALYGGTSNAVEDSVCADTVAYPGIFVSTTAAFSPYPFAGTTSVQRNTLTRAGGPMYGQEHGALKLFADGQPVTNVVVKDVAIDDATFSGVHVQGPNETSGVVLDGVRITGAGTFGIHVDSNARGSAQATDVVVSGGAAGAGLDDASNGAFMITKGAGDVGW